MASSLKPSRPAPSSPTQATPAPSSPTQATPAPSSPAPSSPTQASPAPLSPTQASPAPSSPLLCNFVPSSPEPSSLLPSSPVLFNPASPSPVQRSQRLSRDELPDIAAQHAPQYPLIKVAKPNQEKTVHTPTTRPVHRRTTPRMPTMTATGQHRHLSTPMGQLASAISPGFRNRALDDPSIARNLFAERTRGHGELPPQVWSFLKRTEGQLEYLTCLVEQTEQRMKKMKKT